MKYGITLAAIAMIALAGCEENPQQSTSPVPTPSPVEQAAMTATPQPPATMGAMPEATTETNNGDDILALANQSGCLACHGIDEKKVGPAWKDVAQRYSSDETARAMLIEKVQKGGLGNWTEVTGGIPMPPNSPRVKDDDIAKLVDFILSL